MTDRSSATLSVSEWSSLTSVERCRRISRVASVVAESGELWAELCRRDWREDQLTTISGELLPLCGALKWIGRRGASVLADQRLSIWSRPIWLWGVQNQVLPQTSRSSSDPGLLELSHLARWYPDCSSTRSG